VGLGEVSHSRLHYVTLPPLAADYESTCPQAYARTGFMTVLGRARLQPCRQEPIMTRALAAEGRTPCSKNILETGSTRIKNQSARASWLKFAIITAVTFVLSVQESTFGAVGLCLKPPLRDVRHSCEAL
jgi:hypothetical protein